MNKQLILEQIYALVKDEKNIIANLSNISAFLNQALPDINWVGFYLNENDELVLGPFQGKVACVRIPFEKGVCGTAASQKRTLRIADVHQFQGHIACDTDSRSEIVIPIIKNNDVYGVLDIDSPSYHRFQESDQELLEAIVHVIEKYVI